MTHPYADFRNFVWRVWGHLNLPEPTPLQYDIAHWLQHGPRRQITMAFRGVGKSWITASYVVWTLLLNPDAKVLVVSASKDRADAFSTFVKRLIAELPELRHLAPREGQRDSMIAFDVGPAKADQSPSVKSVGIFGQLTGSRADVIVADDVEVPSTAETQGQRDKLAERVKEFDAVLKPGGRVLFLGTPQTEATLYAVLERRGYETRIWPARVPSEKQVAAYGDRLAPYILGLLEQGVPPGTTTEPKRFSDEDLRERELSYGKAGFALQYMLDPTLSDVDRYPLKLADLVVLPLDAEMVPGRIVWASSPDLHLADLPNVGLKGDRFYRPMMVSQDERDWLPYRSTVMAIDPSGRGADEASYVVLSEAGGRLFLRAVGGALHGYSPETLEAFAKVAREFKVQKVLVEANFGDGMFTELLKPYLLRDAPGAAVEEVKNTRQKELRILDTLEPVIAQHRLVVDPRVIKEDYENVNAYPVETRHLYRLFFQMTRITRDRGSLRQDGRLDALAVAVAHFSERMALDETREIEKRRQDLLEKDLRDFMRAFRGRDQALLWTRV